MKQLKKIKIKPKKQYHGLALFYQLINKEDSTPYKKTIKGKYNRKYRELYAAHTIVTGDLLAFNNTRTYRPVLFSEEDGINIPEIKEKNKALLTPMEQEQLNEFNEMKKKWNSLVKILVRQLMTFQ